MSDFEKNEQQLSDEVRESFKEEIINHFPNRQHLNGNEQQKIFTYFQQSKVGAYLESNASQTIVALANRARYQKTLIDAMKGTN